MSDLLRVENLGVVFRTTRGPVHAVDGIDLAIAPGEVLGLVGESGSGKSVTLRAIARLLHEEARITGRVLWHGVKAEGAKGAGAAGEGQDLLTMPERALEQVRGAGIGAIFQEPMAALNPVLSIGLQIDESLRAHTTLDAGGRRARARELLDLVGIADAAARLAQYPHEFSGGMRQRAMIAIALAANPRLLLADEPTTALDVTIQDQILRLLLRLVSELSMAMLLVTHDLGVVASTCDRVAVMYAGRLCETGPTRAVLRAPRHAYTDALLRALPGEGPARARLQPIPGMPPRIDKPTVGCAFAPRCTHAESRCGTERPAMEAVGEGRVSACFAHDRLGVPA